MSIVNGMVKLDNVRLSFPTLVTPKAFAAGGVEKYSATFLVPEDNTGYQDFTDLGSHMLKEKYGPKAEGIMKVIANDIRLRAFFRGEEKLTDAGEIKDGYEDQGCLSSNTENPPEIVNIQGVKVEGNARDIELAKFYGGCYVNAFVKPWVQDNKFGKALRCELIALQFLSKGEALGGGGRPSADGLFAPVEGAPAQQDDYATNDDGSYTF